MIRSLISGNLANTLSRLSRILLPAALALGAAALPAQQSRLVGQWRGTDHGTTVTIMIAPDGRYIQHAQIGHRMMRETGWADMNGANHVAFTAGTARIPHHAQAASIASIPKHEMPLHSSSTISYHGGNKLIFTDVATHHVITMDRVH